MNFYSFYSIPSLFITGRFEEQASEQRLRVTSEITSQLERSEAARREDKQYSQDMLARLQKEAAERSQKLRTLYIITPVSHEFNRIKRKY